MKCDVCGKNEATIHVTEIVNDKVQELHLCEECARQKGIMSSNKFGLADFLAELTDFDLPSLEKQTAQPELKCPSCGLTFRDFKKTGRLGCSHCYETFKKGLIPLLKKIHGSSRHSGSVPAERAQGKSTSSEIRKLQQKLNKAVEKEEFEQAAKLRDKIKELKRKNKK